MSLKAIIEQWVASTDASDNSKADYKRKVSLWVRWLSARGIDPRSPSHQDLLDWKMSLQKEGKSVFTVSSYITVVKLFYRWCATQGYCEDIGSGIKSSFRSRRYYKLPLSREQCAELLRSINPEDVVGARDRFMIMLMLSNGLRTCEVERANLGDFEVINGKNVLHIQRKGRIDKHDVVAVPDEVMAALKDYLDLRTDILTMDSPMIMNHVRGRTPQRILRSTISAIVKRRLRAIGIDDHRITAHSLRHTCGSLMVEEGVPIETIQDMLGHNDPSTTRIYIDMARQKEMLVHSPSEFIAKIITQKSKKNEAKENPSQ